VRDQGAAGTVVARAVTEERRRVYPSSHAGVAGHDLSDRNRGLSSS
jgi:hypothetical protein